MTRLDRILVLCCLNLLCGIAPAGADNLRLGRDVLPTFQSISLRLDAGTPSYTGSTHIELEVKQPTETFRFHAEGVVMDKIRFSGPKGAIALTTSTGTKGLVTAKAKRALAAGKYTLDIEFHDTFNTDAVGLYRMEKDGRSYAFTQFEADDAREAFPCWDEPEFKIPYQFTISVPENQVAIANTLPEKETVEKGWKTIVFTTTRPLPSYLLAIATGELETVEIPGLGIPARVVTVKGQSHLTKAAVETTGPVLRALEAFFGSSYPYDKLDLIAVPEYWAGAMENAGAITYRDDVLLLDPSTQTVSQLCRLVRINTHELAHMWFGDLVTMQWWDDLWLNESFADWIGDKITQQVYPEFDWELSALQDSQHIMFADAQSSTRAIRQPIESTDNLFENVGLAYDKGKAVLAMFERWIGPETFQKAVIAYLDAHKWGNATADDLWKELDKASGKNVSQVLAGFIEQPGYPLVELHMDAKGNVSLRQTRFHNAGIDLSPLTWRIPITLKYERQGTVETRTLLLDAGETTVDLGTGVTWIYPNADAYGYYRWNVPAEMYNALSASATERLTPRERIALISNSGALLMAGAMTGDAYLRALESMGGDPEPLVLVSLLDALESVKNVIPSGASNAFSAFVRRTLGPAMDRVGMTAASGEDEALSIVRPRLINWLGDEGRDPAIRSFAAQKARSYLEDPATLDPVLVPPVLELAAQEGDRALFDAYRKQVETATAPNTRTQFLYAMGAFRNPELRRAALDYVLSGPIRPHEIFTATRALGENEASREEAYRWMTQNYDAITGRLPKEFAAFMPFYASGCSKERLAKARAFFADPLHQAPGQELQLSEVADQVEDCVGLREREGDAMVSYLEKSTGGKAGRSSSSPR